MDSGLARMGRLFTFQSLDQLHTKPPGPDGAFAVSLKPFRGKTKEL